MLKGFIISLFIILVSLQAGKKFVLDEIDFPVVAQATSETGVPVYYRGEESPRHLGLYHPPLYIYSLAVFMKFFGYSEATVRIFGMLCTLTVALLCSLIIRKLIPDTTIKHYMTLIFLSLFLLHPYTLANTTLPDIDQTVLPVTMLLFVYMMLKVFPVHPNVETWASTMPSPKSGALITMSCLFALNLWAKMTTPLALLPTAFFILLALGYKIRRSLSVVVLIAVFGFVLFIGTYWMYCHFFTLPFDYTFHFLLHSFTKGTSGGSGIISTIKKIGINFSYIRQFSHWLTIPFLFALVLSVYFIISKKHKTLSEKLLMILSLCGLFVGLFYLSLISPFGHFFKYPYPVFSLLILPIAYCLATRLTFGHSEEAELSKSENNQGRRIWFFFGVVFVPIVSYQSFIEKDSALYTGRAVSFSFLVSMVAVALFIGLINQKPSNLKIMRYAASALLAVLIGVQFGISINQAVAYYPTKYEYGQNGMDETITYLKSQVYPTEIIWSMKDVGYYVNNRYIENYGYIFDPSLESKLKDIIKLQKVRYFVVTQGIGEDRIDAYEELRRSLDSCCDVDRIFDNFVVYKARR
jgi:hypothetical protein